jgi:hypothetical protein
VGIWFLGFYGGFVVKHEPYNWNLRDLPVNKRTAAMQSWFRERGLAPPACVGHIEQGIPEIVTITDAYLNGKFFADVEVGVQWKPGGDPVPPVLRSKIGGPGDVFIPEINGMIALVKQWRPALGALTWEIPRGFNAAWEGARAEALKVSIETIPAGFWNVTKEIVEEVGTGYIVEVEFFGEIAENSGTTTTSPRYWWLRLEEAIIGGTESLKLKLVEKSQIMSLIGREIRDSHSITAITLWAKATGLL